MIVLKKSELSRCLVVILKYMKSEMNDSRFSLTTPELIEEAKLVSLMKKILPGKSRKIYETLYSRFMDGRRRHAVLSGRRWLIYRTTNPSTMWSNYSMIQ